ncbi:MAG: asparaginase, partial [Actinomycetota bacterium]|nr:asparaginase [Actinomycetota bacterium]
MSVVLAQVVRSGFIESEHRGSVVSLDTGGTTVFALGDTEVPIFPRSSLKPLQVVGMLRAGLSLAPADIALAAASHSGEAKHVSRVRDLLHHAGLPESALACPPSLPLSEESAQAVIRAGGGPSRVQMNCSGKHAAMLLTCRAAGWPIEGYTDPGHPVQKAIRSAVEDLAGETVAAVGVDGCGAPVFATSLCGLARSFARLAQAEPGSPERAVADAMRAHP